MNYNRRTTRPDGMHYRETRKHVGTSRRRGDGGMHPLLMAAAAAVLAVLGYWLIRR